MRQDGKAIMRNVSQFRGSEFIKQRPHTRNINVLLGVMIENSGYNLTLKHCHGNIRGLRLTLNPFSLFIHKEVTGDLRKLYNDFHYFVLFTKHY